MNKRHDPNRNANAANALKLGVYPSRLGSRAWANVYAHRDFLEHRALHRKERDARFFFLFQSDALRGQYFHEAFLDGGRGQKIEVSTASSVKINAMNGDGSTKNQLIPDRSGAQRLKAPRLKPRPFERADTIENGATQRRLLRLDFVFGCNSWRGVHCCRRFWASNVKKRLGGGLRMWPEKGRKTKNMRKRCQIFKKVAPERKKGRPETKLGKGETKVQKGETKLGKGETKVQKGETKLGKGETKVQKGENELGKGETKVHKGESRLGKGETKVRTGENEIAGHLLEEKAFAIGRRGGYGKPCPYEFFSEM